MFNKVAYTASKWQFRWNKNDVWRKNCKSYRTVLHTVANYFWPNVTYYYTKSLSKMPKHFCAMVTEFIF